jgi:hypothetical protein
MAGKKMWILRGVADLDGKSYPDEKGDPIKWKDGALHEGAAKEYAGFKGYKPVVVDAPGQADQGTTGKPTEQTKEALKRFLGDQSKTRQSGYRVLWLFGRWVQYLLVSPNPGEE